MSGEYDDAFRFSPTKRLTFGYTRHPIWIVLSIDLLGTADPQALEIENELLQYLDIFYVTADRKPHLFGSTGVMRPTSSRGLRTQTFSWDLSALPIGTTTFIIRVQSISSKGLPITLWKRSAFDRAIRARQTVLAFFSGFLLALIAYQILIGLVITSRDYVTLGLLLSTILVLILGIYGVLPTHWPFAGNSSYYYFHAILITCFGFLFNEVAGIFCGDFFWPRAQRIFRFTYPPWIVVYLLVPLQVGGPLINALTAIFCVNFAVVLLSVMIARPLRTREPVLFVVSFIPLVALGVLRVLDNFALLGDSPIVRHGYAAAFPVSALLLGLALSNRLSRIQKESMERKEAALSGLRSLNAAKDEFLNATAHELRTPLHGIIGLSEAALTDGENPLPTVSAGRISTAAQSARRLSSLVDDILVHTQTRSSGIDLEKGAVSLRQIVESVFASMQPLLDGKSVALNHDIPDEIPAVWADENRLHQIMINLVGNAVKFTLVGSVSVSARAAEGTVIFEVSDTGIGIRKEYLSEVFLPYQQGEPTIAKRFGGTGLGLSITRRLVELHEGQIWVESEYGSGSKFSVALPAVPDNKHAPLDRKLFSIGVPVESESVSAWLGTGTVRAPKDDRKRILAIDDEPVNLRVIQSHLPASEYEVLLATSGASILADPSILGDIDCVLLDLYMPDISGFDVCATIRRTRPAHRLPILVLTASSRSEDVARAFRCGANDFITKPVSRMELLARVRAHADLSTAIERAEAANSTLHQIQSIVSFGVTAARYALGEDVVQADIGALDRAATEYYRPLWESIRNVDVSGTAMRDLQTSDATTPAVWTHQTFLDTTRAILRDIDKNIRPGISRPATDHDVYRIATDVFDLVTRLHSSIGPANTDIEIDWKSVQNTYGLTNKEIEACTLVHRGLTNQEIATSMQISQNTVKQHLYHVFNKVGVDNRTHLVFRVTGKLST